MFESILTITLTGFIAGFIFAMPIAGPISVLIVSNALSGRRKTSNLISIGASVSDFIYIFIAVYGITRLYYYYGHLIPYLLIAGALFFLFLGVRLFRQKVDIEQFEAKTHINNKVKDNNRGFYTGFTVNMLNPTQFISGLISSFFVISLLASFGFNTGGLEKKISDNVKEIETFNGEDFQGKIPERMRNFDDVSSAGRIDRENDGEKKEPGYLVLSIFYALAISLGGLIWFYLLAWILSRFRKLINIKILTLLIKTFAVILCIIGLYFGYLGAVKILHL